MERRGIDGGERGSQKKITRLSGKEGEEAPKLPKREIEKPELFCRFPDRHDARHVTRYNSPELLYSFTSSFCLSYT